METRDNEYLSKYWDICENAKVRELKKNVYVEKHHIYPKSIYGKNDILVKLTLQEHFLVHKYLWLGLREKYGSNHHYTRCMANAFRYMCSTKHKTCISTPEEYEFLRIAHTEANRNRKHTQEFKDKARERSTGKNNKMYGKSHYSIWVEKYGKEEADILEKKKHKKMIETRTLNGNLKMSEESKRKNSIAHLGKKASEETRQKLKDAISNRDKEYQKEINKRMLQTRIKNGNLKHSEESKQKMSEKSKGEKNSMYGKSVYSIWVEKYGKEEADIRKQKMKETRKKNKELKNKVAEGNF